MAKVFEKNDLIDLEVDELLTELCPGGWDKKIGESGTEKVHSRETGNVQGPETEFCPDCKGLGLVRKQVVGKVVFSMKPMDYRLKLELLNLTKTVNGREITDQQEKAVRAIRATVKKVQGIFKADGKTPYELKFDDRGDLTDDCVSDLMNLDQTPELIAGALAFISGIPTRMLKRGEVENRVRFVFPGEARPN